MSNLNQESNIFLYSAKIYPAKEELDILNNCLHEIRDWKGVTQKLISSNMGSLFYVKIPYLTHAEIIPPETKKKLKEAYLLVLSRNVLINNVLKETITLLSENGIEVIVLKGAYLSEALYGDVALRTLSDIDLLCRNEEEAQRAFQLLLEAGYSTDEEDKMLEFLRDNIGAAHLPQIVHRGIPIELHTRLHHHEEEYDFPPREMWKHHEQVTLNGVKANVPDLTDLLIHTCLHLDKHFKNGLIQLSWFNDIVNILEVYRSKIDWELLISCSVRYKCEYVVFKYIMLVYKEYNVPVPKYMVAEYLRFLPEKDIALFRKYLSGFQGEHYSVQSAFKKINTLNGTGSKLKYVLWMMFPSPKYMMRSYRLENKNWVWLYYPYRFWLGLLGGIRTLRQQKNENKKIRMQ